MEDCPGDRRCLICRRPTLENSSINSEKPISNANLLQDLFNCFHINVLDSEVNDLTTSCQFCPTCEQFLAEWSSTQTQMTQLTRRASQLKSTLSALLLSAHEIQKRNHNEDVTEIINNGIQHSHQGQLPLWLQETIDEIRNELRKEYSVRVMLDKIPVPSVQKVEPLLIDSDDDVEGEPGDHMELGANDCDEEYLPSEDELCNEETSERISGLRVKTEAEANSGDSNSEDSVSSNEMSVKEGRSKTNRGPKRKKKRNANYDTVIPDGPNRFKYKGISFQRNEEDQTYTCDRCGFRSEPTMTSILYHIVDRCIEKVKVPRRKSEKQPVMIPDGPNRFKYNGYDVRFNDEDELYYCGVCNLRGHTTSHSTLAHIRHFHYTAEDKIKFTTVRISDTEWLYGGKYKIIKLDEKKLKCVSCGSFKAFLHKMVAHIRTQHVDSDGPDKVVPLPENDFPPLSVHCDNKDEPMDEPRGDVHSGMEYLPNEDESNEVETCETILGIPSVNDSTQYSAHVLSDNTALPLVQILEAVPVESGNDTEFRDDWECGTDMQLPFVTKLEPLLDGNENVDEPWDHWEFGADHCDEDEDPLNDEETSEQILGMSFKTEEEANCDDGPNFQESAESEGVKAKAGNRMTNRGPRKSEKEPTAIRVGRNRFKYNGYDVILNDEDQCYYCGICNYNGHTTITSTLAHIRNVHYTAEDIIKFTAVRTSDTEWLYGGKYKITKVEEKKLKCMSCGSMRSYLHKMVAHIRSKHVDSECPDQC